MKIISLTAENVKKLTAVEISPDGNIVQITGKNGQGKTSVLDSIWWALAGTSNIQKQPIRSGAESARIELKLGTGKVAELIVERRFTEKASYLEVKTADGAKYPAPQKLLDDVIGALAFDPFAFMRQDARGQFNLLKGLVTLDVDLEQIDSANKFDFEARTAVNREAKSKRAQALGITITEGLPAERVDEQALLDRMTSASDTNTDIERRKNNRAAAGEKIGTLKAEELRLRSSIEADTANVIARRDEECGDLERQIAVLHRKVASAKERADAEIRLLVTERTGAADTAAEEANTLQAKLESAEPLGEPVDVSAIRAELETAHRTNAAIAERERKANIIAEAETLEKKATDLTTAMADREKQKADAIAKAKMPVDGLSFGDGVVTFNGLPLDQASDAEQLMVSTAIAAAINPKLRVLRIRDGSLLDEDAMTRLAAFAAERDFQIWIERVDGSGTVGFVMEDGHVKGAARAVQAARAAE